MGRCLGSPMHLKKKYSSGYQVELRLAKKVGGTQNFDQASALAARNKRAEELLEFLKSSLSPEARCLETYDDSFLFQLPPLEKSNLSLGSVFSTLQRSKEQQGFLEYTLTQASLEQVFLRFAREQVEAASLE